MNEEKAERGSVSEKEEDCGMKKYSVRKEAECLKRKLMRVKRIGNAEKSKDLAR